MTAYLAGAVGAAMEAEESQARLDIVLRATGGAAGVTSEMATDLATSLSQVTRFSDDTIIAAESVLLRFQGIGEETFPQATKATLDLAATLGIDASAAAFQLGRALEAPGEGLRVLTRAGIILTDQEKEMIDAMVLAGDTAGAQGFILDKLSSSIGGAAEAMGQTFAGQVDIFKNRLSEVQEGIGMALLPVLGDLIDKYLVPLLPVIERLGVAFSQWITGVAVPAFERFLPVLEEFGQQIFQWIVNTAIPALQQFSDWVSENRETILAVLAGIATGFAAFSIITTVVGWITGLIAAVTAVGTAIGAAGGIIATIVAILGGPLTIAIAAVAAIIGLLVVAWTQNWGDIQGKTEAVWAFIEPLIGTAIKNIQMTITLTLEAIRQFWDEHGEGILAAASAIWTAIVGYITTSINQIQAIVQFISNAIQVFWAAWGDTILAVAENTWNAILETIDNVILIVQGIIDIFIGAFTGDWELFGEGLRKVWDGVWAEVVTILETAWDNISEIIGQLIEEIISFFSNTDWGAVGRSIIDGIKNGIENAAGGLATAAANAARAAWDAVMGFIGGHSPSTLFEKAGVSAVEGFIVGIETMTSKAVTAMQTFAGAVTGAFMEETTATPLHAPQDLQNIMGLLQTGDFAGGILGLMEDDPLISGLLAFQDYVVALGYNTEQIAAGMGPVLDLLASGDFVGGIFGLPEDSPFIGILLELSKLLSSIENANALSFSAGQMISPLASTATPHAAYGSESITQNISVGPNNISSPMTQAVFEARLRQAIQVSS